MHLLRFICLTLLLAGNAAAVPGKLQAPVAAEEAGRTFQMDEGLEVSLTAAEPIVVAPSALAFDENGRLFVAENRDYPTGPRAGNTPGGRIAMLEDGDGDGRFEKRSDFATGLTYPNGVACWDGGIIVTCAPDLLFLKDTDGNGQADERRVLLTGFDTSQTTQLRMAYPVVRPDGWLYLTSGWGGLHRIADPARPGQKLLETNRDVRWNLKTGELQPLDSRAQFGQAFDTAGRRFLCFNRVHCQHQVCSASYWQRTPHLRFTETVQDCPAGMVDDLLPGRANNAARLFPVSENLTTADSHAGQFSAACGILICQAAGLGADYDGSFLACDPTGNLVHRDRLTVEGATFRAEPAGVPQREFFACTDNWFRPVFLGEGPDGALYVCDMYRRTIEHPQYLPDEVRAHTDFDSGAEMGRIWRIARKNVPRRVDLSADLDHPNGWNRMLAVRKILAGSMPLPEEPPSTAPGRILALQLSARPGEPLILACSRDPSSSARYAAAEVLEQYAAASPVLAGELIRLSEDPDPSVQFRALLSCIVLSAEMRLPILTKRILAAPTDRWTEAAILSAAAGIEGLLLRELTQAADRPGQNVISSYVPEIAEELARLAAHRIPESSFFAEPPTLTPLNLPALAGLLRAADERGMSEPGRAWLRSAQPPFAPDAIAADTATPPAVRRAVIRILAFLRDGTGAKALHACFRSSELPDPLRAEALTALLAIPGETESTALLNAWEAVSVHQRDAIIEGMCGQPRHALLLTRTLKAGKLPLLAISAAQRQMLQRSPDALVRDSAAELFAAAGGADRMKVYEDWKSVLSLKSKPQNGREIFRRACAVCHRLEREGFNIGPDLFGMRNQPPEVLLLHILVPNREISTGFHAVSATLKDGRTLTGILAAETASARTIRGPGGAEETVNPDQIAKIETLPVSLMPDALEQTMSQQDMADLIAWLRGRSAEQ